MARNLYFFLVISSKQLVNFSNLNFLVIHTNKIKISQQLRDISHKRVMDFVPQKKEYAGISGPEKTLVILADSGRLEQMIDRLSYENSH